MFQPKFKITTKVNKALVEIERVRGFLEAVELKEKWINELQQKALILESHHSTHIEGTAIEIEQAQEILSGKGLNSRQELAVQYLLQHKKIRVCDYEKITSCIRRTAQRDLNDLVKKKLIKAVGKNATDPTRYYQLL